MILRVILSELIRVRVPGRVVMKIKDPARYFAGAKMTTWTRLGNSSWPTVGSHDRNETVLVRRFGRSTFGNTGSTQARAPSWEGTGTGNTDSESSREVNFNLLSAVVLVELRSRWIFGGFRVHDQSKV